MSLKEIVQQALMDLSPIYEGRDGVTVSTHCIYPSNSFVQVSVRGGVDAFVVSDNGGAILEVEGSGGTVRNVDGMLKRLIPEVCEIRKGVISSGVVSRSDLPAMISVVSNASKDVAEWLFAHLRIKHSRQSCV